MEIMMNKKLMFAVSSIVIVAGITFAACAEDTPPPYAPPAFATSGDETFDKWRLDFASRAVNINRKDPKVIESMLDGLTPNSSVTRLNNSQPEMLKPIGDYIASAVSQSRVNDGRTNYLAKTPILSEASAKYGVPLEVAIAIWGMETSYGANKGSSDVVRALATLAYDGRRKELGENELLAVADIIKNNDATRDMLVGSWAGAMGHTQFMPSSYLKWAVDGDNDGKRNIWGDDNDALASTFNYLASVGWKSGEPWGKEVNLKDDFDYSLADGTFHSIEFWRQKGVTDVWVSDGWKCAGVGNTACGNGVLKTTEVPANWQAYLLIPAGANGPKFLVGVNYKAIKHYNNSDSYALSVGLLADQIAGKGKLVASFANADPLVTRTQAKELQTLLTNLGYDIGVIDGAPGSKTRLALQNFQKSHNMVADGYPSQKALQSVKLASGIYSSDALADDATQNSVDNITTDANGNPIPVRMFEPVKIPEKPTNLKNIPSKGK
jgi:lytic murein transglycosylase